MPSILVVEPDAHYVERIQSALGAEGWSVRVVASVDQALHTSPTPPDLVLAATDLPGFEVLVFSFSRRSGGPGVVGLQPESGSGGGDGADARIAKPFTVEQVVLTARQALLARRPSGTGGMPVVTAVPEHKLTSKDIFGDVLAEVEAGQAPRPVIAPPRAVPPPPPPAATAPASSAGASGDDVQRRLEKTLSGMLTPDPRPRPAAPPAPPPPPRRVETGAQTAANASSVDALLSKTLSNLEMGRPKPAAPPASPPAAPAADGTAVRKGRAVGDFDFAELEELARTSTRPGTSVGAPPAGAPPAPPRPAAPAPPPGPLAFTPPAPAPMPVPPPPPPPVAPTGASVFPAVPALPALPAIDAAATQRIPVFADEGSGQTGERFGQYTLLERIAVGGMAEVWKARMRGVEGFQKTVAIKRILPHMTDNAEFVGMFIDEAKLAAQLTHPNIVHIYDLGKIGRDYYIAMEYVDGRDLRSLLNAGRRKGMPLPLGLSLLIAARLASALDYAHRKRDFEDRELGLVHRDVSPQNVLLTAEGDVKLCDFGIAKAVSKASQTQMGALKGKLQYMSPEQAWGRPVDGRSDLFSLGAVLFEMVTGERLFAGDSEISVLEAVRQGRVRTPRQVDPSLPREVDEIVTRALALEPQDRFQSAGEMKQRLEGALAVLAPSTGAADLAIYIQRLLDAEAPQHPTLSAPPAAAAAPELPPPSFPPPPAMPAMPPPSPSMSPLPEAPPPPEPVTATTSTGAPLEAVAPLGRVAVGEGEGGRKSRTLLYVAIAALVAIAIFTFWFLNHRKAPPPAPGAVPTATSNPSAVPPPPAANPAQPSAGPAVPGAPPAAGSSAVDLKAMVDRQLAGKEEELRKKNEAKLKELEKQVAAAAAGKTAGAPLPAGAAGAKTASAVPPPSAASTKAAAPEPAPQAAPPPRVPEPAKPEEKAPAPAPAPAAPAPSVEAAKREAEPAAPRTKVGELVEMGSGVVPPQLVSSPKPGYPPMARTLRVEGVVVCSVLVDENGEVQDVKIAESIKKNVGLNEAAVAAARASHYKPASKDGVRVKMWTRLKIPFKL